MQRSTKQTNNLGGKSQNLNKKFNRENILKKAARKRFRANREKQMLDNRPVLNRQDTQKKIRRNLAIARRKMKQILKIRLKIN